MLRWPSNHEGTSTLEPKISLVAQLIGDTARSKMLTALMGGKALTATELAIEADITPQTASSHLSKLFKGELVVVRKQGRHKYFQLKNTQVAELLEALLNLSANIQTPHIKTGPRDPGLKNARVCYDHLAGELGVALYDALVSSKYIIDQSHETILTDKGRVFFQGQGFDFNAQKKSRRPICKSCLDWSERRNHLSGVLGQWILSDIFNKNWATKDPDSRSLRFSKKGLSHFSKTYGAI